MRSESHVRLESHNEHVNLMIEHGRIQQKARTRDALIRAARQLLASEGAPTVEQAAVAASISRATAYRYFPNQRALLEATYPEIAETSLLGEHPPSDPEARLEIVAAAMARQAVEHEAELRVMLRLSLESAAPDPATVPFRVGRRIGWGGDALPALPRRAYPPEL